jgi:hypothetical protein
VAACRWRAATRPTSSRGAGRSPSRIHRTSPTAASTSSGPGDVLVTLEQLVAEGGADELMIQALLAEAFALTPLRPSPGTPVAAAP